MLKERSLIKYFLIILVPLAVLFGITLTVFYNLETTNHSDFIKTEVFNIQEYQAGGITSELDTVVSDLMFLSEQNELTTMLKKEDEDTWRRALSEEYFSFLKRKGIYDQIRFLDETGMEIIRVNFNDGSPGIVPDEGLQSKVNRYYFEDTFALEQQQVFISPFDLNIEHGELDQPLKPIIRFGTPVFDSNGRKRGIVILNYLGVNLLQRFEDTSRVSGHSLLLNSSGFYLSGLKPEDEWGFMYEDRSDRTFGDTFPEAWDEISAAESGQFNSGDGMFLYKTIFPILESYKTSTGSGEVFNPSTSRMDAQEYYWKFVYYIPQNALNADIFESLIKFVLLYGLIVVLLAVGSWALARAYVKRALAEKELQQHSDHLEEMVSERTKELEESQEKLITSERLATLGQFSGSISHELRNPLAVVGSSAYYLKSKLKDADKKVLQHLDRIQSSVGNATTIIDSLLNLTRMKEPQLGELGLIAIIRDSITASKVPSSVKVERSFPEQDVRVVGDREQLRMAFKNIVKNALEAMNGDGTLSVAVQNTDEGYAEVSFTDTGTGISAEDLEKIFVPLFTTKATGIGFGLSITKTVIEKHNGTIAAQSEPGKGTTIVLRLPLYIETDK